MTREQTRAQKSMGHIAFGNMAPGGWAEFFIRNGELHRAPVDNPVMPDGFRCGRWQCSENQADKALEMLGVEPGDEQY